MMKDNTAEETLSTLYSLFARLGLPDQMVSDNGPQFTSEALREFTTANGAKHVTGAHYHPETNGQAQNLVQKSKTGVMADKPEELCNTSLKGFIGISISPTCNHLPQPSGAPSGSKCQDKVGSD